jgi:cholinesterase
MWIYGGAFVAGTSNGLFYNGARIANDEDVVVVSFNYRINFFGFSHAPGQEQNVGLLDQRLAVEWVRDNIAAFGGDPKRITLFGESAGAASVDYYAYAYPKDPIVHGLIAQSPYSGGPIATSNPTKGWYEVSKKMNCGGPEVGEKSVECMRSKSANDIMSAVGFSFFTPIADEKFVFANAKARAAAGQIAKIVSLLCFPLGTTLLIQ